MILAHRMVALLLVIFGGSALAAEDIVIEATLDADTSGRSHYWIDGKEQTPQEYAVNDALRRVVGTAAEKWCLAEPQTIGARSLCKKIVNNPSKYIKEYSIFSSTRKGKPPAVTLGAVIDTDRLSSDLEVIAVSKEAKPSVMLMIAEKNVAERAPAIWWARPDGGAAAKGVEMRFAEEAILAELGALGFGLVDPEKARSTPAVLGSIATSGPTAEQVRRIGELTRADVVVVGSAEAAMIDDNVMGVGITSVRATVMLRALHCGTGEWLGSTSAFAIRPALTEMVASQKAIEEASAIAARLLQGKIMKGVEEKKTPRHDKLP